MLFFVTALKERQFLIYDGVPSWQNWLNNLSIHTKELWLFLKKQTQTHIAFILCRIRFTRGFLSSDKTTRLLLPHCANWLLSHSAWYFSRESYHFIFLSAHTHPPSYEHFPNSPESTRRGKKPVEWTAVPSRIAYLHYISADSTVRSTTWSSSFSTSTIFWVK